MAHLSQAAAPRRAPAQVRAGALAFTKALDVLCAISDATCAGPDPDAYEGGDFRDYRTMSATLADSLRHFAGQPPAFQQGYVRALLAALASQVDVGGHRGDMLAMTATAFGSKQ